MVVLDELAAIKAIRQAALRYCRGVDRLDLPLTQSAYHPDAIDDHGVYVRPNGCQTAPRARLDCRSVTHNAADDEREIIKLTVRYCWALDTRQFDDLRQVFAEDATGDYGPDIGLLEGVAAVADICERALSPLDASQHIVANHEVVLDGDKATSRCYFQAQHVRRAAQGGPNLIIAGIYADRLVRTGDGWRIQHRTLTPVWSDGNPNVLSI